MDSDPAIASQKPTYLQFKTGLKMENESQRIQVHPRNIQYKKRNMPPPPVQINNMQLPEEDVKYLGLHLDRRLTWHKLIFAKRKHLGITLIKMYWLLGRKSKFSTSNKFLIYKTIFKPIWTYGIALGYGFHFQHRHSTTFPIESLAHYNERTLVCVEYGYPKGSPNTNS
jgi:hypothetical protein